MTQTGAATVRERVRATEAVTKPKAYTDIFYYRMSVTTWSKFRPVETTVPPRSKYLDRLPVQRLVHVHRQWK